MSATIIGFVFDVVNVEEMGAHGLTPEDLEQMLETSFGFKRNRKSRRATHLIVGRNRQGQCIAIPVEHSVPGKFWRPVTVWYGKAHEWGWLPR